MATNGPPCIDVAEYQFKLYQKSIVFNATGDLRSKINLLATSSNYGLVFIGDPHKPEFRVLQHENLINVNDPGEKLLARNVLLPGIPNNIAVSCDGLLLAVNYTQRYSDFLTVYSVPSFLTPNIETKYQIRVHPEDNTNVTQILWNPVISNTFALILSNGAVGMYNLKENSYEFYSLDKNEQAKCGCWSPKGKQIVIGFPDGKLIQYKPDLKPAKTISCPSNIHEMPFDTIAVQWLSTYQFAVVFLQRGQDKLSILYILNAPKSGNQTYIDYGDICYSGSGPRQAQIFFNHIQSWNILLMASANSVEVGILGTKETGETPIWQQYITLDEARIELPLTSDKQETFPIGIAFDTGCTHQLTIGETQVPVMPMIHVLSTHGMLISFDFLNLIPNAAGICSPPNSVSDISGYFKSIEEILNIGNEKLPPVMENKNNQGTEMSFSLSSGATSTPTADRKGNAIFVGGNTSSNTAFNNSAVVKPLFVPSNNTVNTTKPLQFAVQQQPTNLFGGQAFSQKTLFGGNDDGTTTFALNVAQTSTINQQKDGNQLTFGQPLTQSKPMSFVVQQTPDDTGKSKPLYTVPPTFTPAQQQKPLQQSKQQQQQQQQVQPLKIQEVEGVTAKMQQNDSEVNDIIKQMIETQINAFEKELHELSRITTDLNISAEEIEETRSYTKRLDNLKELNDLAKDGGIEADVQALRHSLNECFIMVAEAKSKLNMYNNPHLSQLATMSNVNQASRRQLAKLRQFVATNELQLNMINQLIDAQWSNYQDLVRQNSSKRKYMPNLEGIYQTLIHQKDIIAKERIKLNYFKSKLGIKGLLDDGCSTWKMKQNDDINSLADSILSMSLSEKVVQDNLRLTDDKLKIIRDTIKNRQIIKIKPQRPDRIGLNSEVILETKAKTVKQLRDSATKTKSEKIKQEQNTFPTKPIPTKGISVLNSNQMMTIQSQQQPKKVESKKQQQQKQQQQSQPLIPIGTVVAEASQKIPQQQKALQQQQQIKEIQYITTTMPQPPPSATALTFPSVKTNVSQPTMITNIFSGGLQPSNQTLIFGGQTKPLFSGSLSITPQPAEVISDKPKTSTSSFAFGNGIEKVDNNIKEIVPPVLATGISFAPKVVDNDQQSAFGVSGFRFVTIQDENKPTIEAMKNLTSTTTETTMVTMSTVANQPSPFSTFRTTFPSSTENKSLFSGTGFGVGGVLSSKDTNTTQLVSMVPTASTTQSTVLSSQSGPLSFGGLSLSTTKTGTDTIKSQELPPTPASTSTSSESLISSASVTESSSFSLTSKAPPLFVAATSASPPSFSFGSIQKPLTTATTATAVPLSNTLTGALSLSFAPSSTTTTAVATAATTPSSSSSFNFGSFGSLGPISTPPVATTTTATPIAMTTTTTEMTTTTVSSATETVAPTDLSVKANSSAGNDQQATILQDLNICEPIASGTKSPTATTNVFAGNLFEGKSLTASTVAETNPNFGTTVATTSSPGIAFGSTTAFAAPGFGVTPGTAPSGSIFGGVAISSPPSFFGNTTGTTTAPLFGTISTPATSTTPSVFSSGTAVVTSLPSSTSVFGATTGPATSVFGTSLPATSAAFGSTTSATTLPTFGSPTATTSAGGNLFGGIPKPAQPQPVFGVSGAASFTANTATPLFAGQAVNQAVSSAASIFGGTSSTTPAFGMQLTTSAPSVFGASATAVSQSTSPFGAPSNATTSVFGSPKSETTTNLFGTVSQSSPASGGSLFGSSSFGSTGQTTGSIFGGGSGAGTQPSGFSSAFGQPSTSPFGGTSTQQQQHSSPFGGGGNAGTSSSGFGQNSFSSPSSFGQATGGGGGFSSSPPGGVFTQGFGSPGSFSKPVFGGSPTFGSAPTFGGAPTFGTPKPSFGAFAQTNTGAFSPPTQKNNLFESLGSSDTGLSFGNLAQNANANAAAKSQFGGSSFSGWR